MVANVSASSSVETTMNEQEALLKYEDVTKLFRNKDKATIQKNGSYDRKMLIETIFSLIEACEAMKIREKPRYPSTDEIAEACSRKTEKIIEKILAEKYFESEKPVKSAGGAPSYALVIDNPETDNQLFTPQSWAQVVEGKFSETLNKVPVSKPSRRMFPRGSEKAAE